MNFRQGRSNRSVAVLEVTPLVDVVFLLLIFFLLTATYVQNPNLDINLPKASMQQLTAQQKDLAIAITDKGELRYDGAPITLDKLEDVLRTQYADNQDVVVVIRADQSSKHGRVVEVMDLAKRVGFAKLAIAIQAQYGTD